MRNPSQTTMAQMNFNSSRKLRGGWPSAPWSVRLTGAMDLWEGDGKGGALLHRNRGFSMIEITLALGIVAFALVSIIGMMGIGLNAGHSTRDEDTIATIVNNIVTDRQTSTFTNASQIYSLPSLNQKLTYTASTPIYFLYDGRTNTPLTSDQGAYYRIRTSVSNFDVSDLAPSSQFSIRVEWPIASKRTNTTTFSTVITRASAP